MENKKIIGHLAALMTILVWGTTFISTKVLLTGFQPIEILFCRFIMGYLALVIASPHRIKKTGKKQEVTFALAGLCGVCLYYLLENIALTYTMASNVGVITSIAPVFTAILSWIFLKSEDFQKGRFFLGFTMAMIGICLISFNGSAMELNPLGDLLAVLAAFVWACYSLLTRKIGTYGYPTIQVTRRIFSYGILFMIPALYFFDFHLDLTKFANPVYLFNIVFLGLGASALCFVTWNYAVKMLGAVKTSTYIYALPIITVITSVIVLQEEMTAMAVLGTLFTLAGLVVSESKRKLPSFLKKIDECKNR